MSSLSALTSQIYYGVTHILFSSFQIYRMSAIARPFWHYGTIGWVHWELLIRVRLRYIKIRNLVRKINARWSLSTASRLSFTAAIFDKLWIAWAVSGLAVVRARQSIYINTDNGNHPSIRGPINSHSILLFFSVQKPN